MQNVVAKNLQEVLHKWFIFHFVLMDRRQISFRKLSEFEQNKYLLFLLKSSENLWFFDDFGGIEGN